MAKDITKEFYVGFFFKQDIVVWWGAFNEKITFCKYLYNS